MCVIWDSAILIFIQYVAGYTALTEISTYPLSAFQLCFTAYDIEHYTESSSSTITANEA